MLGWFQKHRNCLRRFHTLLICGLTAIIAASAAVTAADTPKPVLKTEHFDSDPGWEGYNKRIVLEKIPTAKQDFG